MATSSTCASPISLSYLVVSYYTVGPHRRALFVKHQTCPTVTFTMLKRKHRATLPFLRSLLYYVHLDVSRLLSSSQSYRLRASHDTKSSRRANSARRPYTLYYPVVMAIADDVSMAIGPWAAAATRSSASSASTSCSSSRISSSTR